MKTFKKIADLVAFAMTDKTNENAICIIKGVNKKEAEQIRELTGKTVEGYSHIIDRYAVRHIFEKHGDSRLEMLRGQIEVKSKDLEHLGDILKFENIAYSGFTKLGRPALFYVVRVGTKYFCVEEIRTGRKQLAITSMYKRK